jgi:hypothetical protein
MPDWRQMCRKVDDSIRGMIGHGQRSAGTVRILPDQGDMLTLTHGLKAE